LWYGAASENNLSSGLCARHNAPDTRGGSRIRCRQLGLLWDSSEAYSWQGSTLDYHLAQIRQHSGWRFPTAQDKEELENWLRNQGAKERTRRTRCLIPRAGDCGA
jgi:hypothetical protein